MEMNMTPARRRMNRAFPVILSGSALLVVLLAGCASQAARGTATQGVRGDKDAAGQLYAGQPAVVHATEYPVSSAAEGIQRGDQAWSHGKLDLAVYLYVQSLAFDATDAGPFLKIGAIHERLGNRALAERAFELALEREPDNAAACERLGLLYLQSQRNDQARGLFEHAISRDADRWQSHNGLGIAADRRSDFAAAIAHYDTAFVLEPRAAAVVNNRGYSRYLAGDLTGAKADFIEAIRLGALSGTWTNLGRVQAKQARYAEALESLLKETDLAHAYNLLGEVAMEIGDYPAAQKYFTSAIGASPRYFKAAQENLGLVNERLAEPAQGATNIARIDTSAYVVDAKGVVIGKVMRGSQVSVLRAQDSLSLVRFRVSGGAELTGWVSSASLGNAGPR
jgi:Flp pilus assembly protein TadD